jgi:cobalt-zinc-cadmium efflux system membrane fusion protein
MKYISYLPIIWLLSCGVNETTTRQNENDTENQAIQLTAQQEAEVGIVTGRLEKRLLTVSIHATGVIDVPPNQRAEIHSPIEVFVDDIKVLPGDRVKKGEVLAIVNHPKLIAMQQQYNSLVIEKDKIAKQLQRKSELLNTGVTSQNEVDQLTSDLAKVKSEMSGLSAQLSMLNIQPGASIQRGTLKASIEGQVIDLGVTRGVLLAPEKVAFTLLDTEHKHLELNVFPKEASNLETGQLVNFNVTNKNQKGQAAIYLVNPIVSDNHAVMIHAHISRDESPYLVGDFVHAMIETTSDSAYVIATKELIYSGDSYSLFVKTPRGYQSIEVVTGRSNDEFTELLGPESLFGSEVVLEGNYYVNGM